MSAEAATLDRPDATPAQRDAADPAASVWVAASAGSGKTKVLVDRVLSLLLDENTLPERILCLTFTKAAAVEMANRVNARLGVWAMARDADLAADLTALTGSPPDEKRIARARRLFARVLDLPGGLKIQTVHGFCQSLLGRFPVEAGIAPHFEVIDERGAAELMQAARDRVLERAVTEPTLEAALGAVTEHVDEQRFAGLMAELSRERHRLSRLILKSGGIDAVIAESWNLLSLDPAETDDSLLAAASADAAFDGDGLLAAAAALLSGTEKTDRPRGRTIADWLERIGIDHTHDRLRESALHLKDRADSPGWRIAEGDPTQPGSALAAGADERVRGFDAYAAAFLTAGGDIRARLATGGVQKALPNVVEILGAEGLRLQAVQARRAALVTARATAGLLRLGDALLAAYAAAKRAIAKLDYDDLILKTRQLLTWPGAASWVLFKLDGGLDHILIDEAQDTGPEQWEVVAALAEEFFAGTGARETVRTIFAVGDVKQSIYSFQRADPEAFRQMREHFAERVRHAEGVWRAVGLDVSYRSTAAVLQAVDAVFARPETADGVLEADETMHHRAWRTGQAGLVELWPPIGPRDGGDNDGDDEDGWTPPLERRAGDDPQVRLARVLAARIAGWIGRETLEPRGRKLRAGDIMVLLRKRSPFIDPLVRALKDCGVPVSGIDRMVLTEQIAVMDLVVLGRFLLLPEDDLSLATALKSPLVGLDDDDLFRLAYGRGGKSLWQRLREEAATEPRYEAARAWLADLLSRVDFLHPYELFAKILMQPTVDYDNGRRRMLARLGPDADDPIDEFLNLALAYERGRAASLEGFLHWLEAGEAEVKRDLEQAAGRDEVRVMTVHGAKGLQAPIVIMPDTMSKPRASPLLLWSGDAVLWPPRRACEEAMAAALREDADRRRDQEYRRLLYVAMTRAEDRLYVCGAHGKQGPAEGCWYDLVRNGLAAVAEDVEFSFDRPAGEGWSGPGLRLAGPQESEPRSETLGLPAATGAATVQVEDWMLAPAPAEPVPARPLAPSRPAEVEPAIRSPAGDDPARRFRRGILTHRLLETLPDIAPDQRQAAARRYLARPVHGLSDAMQDEIAREVIAVLEDPAFAPVFGPASRAEVPIAGLLEGPDGPRVVSGQIDRLVVTPDAVLIIDYKSNRPPPARAEDVPALYWRQMAAYRAVIAQIYPDRPVHCALLWTDGPVLMPLSGPHLDRAAPQP